MLIERIAEWRGRWANTHWVGRVLLLALVLVLGGWFGVKPAYRLFKGWRLEQNLQAAKVAVAAGRMTEARDLSLTVVRAGDPRIEVLRILEQSMAALRDPLHADMARALLDHPESSDEDRLNGFRGVAGEMPLGLVGQAWMALPEPCRLQPGFAVVFAERLLTAQRATEATSVLLAVPEAARTPAVEQGLIRVLIGSGKPEGAEEGQRRLASHWPATGAGPAGWLELLEDIPVQRLRADLLAPVRGMLEQDAAADPPRHALALARLDYAADFPGRAAVIERTIARWQAEAPVAVARLLRDLGLHQRLLATFPASAVSATPGLLPHVLEALEQTGAWAEVKSLLAGVGDGMAKFEVLGHQAVAAGKTGDTPGMAELWAAAMADARFSADPHSFLELSQIARAGGLEDEAGEALLEAVLRGRGPLPLFTQLKPLMEWLSRQGRDSSLLKVCTTYLLFEPGDPVLLTQYSYLACLTGSVEPPSILKAITPLAKAFPDELPIQCVLAVAHLCNGDPAAAAAVVDGLKVDLEQLAPGYRAVFLATLLLNQRIDPQDPRIVGFPWKSLMPSERKRFTEWLKVAGT